MQVEKHTVVAIDYTLTDDDGQLIDTSEGHQPLSYLHGVGSIVPGLERKLTGKQIGDELEVAVTPAEGYGERNEDLLQQVARESFAGIDDLAEGMQFRVDSDDGPLVVTVVDIAEDIVTVDGNHPLAGFHLNFRVTVRDVRAATEEEIAHGHVHGPGGQEHEADSGD